MLILTILLIDLLTGMEFDLFVPSFPELKDYFRLSPFWLELSLSVNLVGYCISLFITGHLADSYGRKPIILWGLLIFVGASVLCLSTSIYYLFLLGRFFQGLGIAAPAILSFLIIADSFSIKKQQFWLSIFNGVKNMSIAIAPVVGSYITYYFHWEGNFVTLLLLGLTALLMTWLFIPAYKVPHQKEYKASSPYGYTAIFKSNILMLLTIYFILTFAPYWIFVGMSPLLYMQDLGVDLTHFGYYQGSLAFAFALGSLISSFVIIRFNQKNMLYTTNSIYMLSFITLMLAVLENTTSPLLITLAFLPFIIGQIIPSNVLYPLYLNLMPSAKGRLTALIQGGQFLFAALGLQIAGYFYQGSFRNIGIILASIICMTIIMLFVILKNWNSITPKQIP